MKTMRTPGKQPRILLTNVKQLELLLTRQQDIELFAGARLDYLVFDEAHTFTGAMGAETACLIRRLRSFCNIDPGHTRCIATSATIVDPQEPDAARNFAARFFGVPVGEVVTVREDYQAETWAEPRVAATGTDGGPVANPGSVRPGGGRRRRVGIRGQTGVPLTSWQRPARERRDRVAPGTAQGAFVQRIRLPAERGTCRAKGVG